jgi:hypothetical protein
MQQEVPAEKFLADLPRHTARAPRADRVKDATGAAAGYDRRRQVRRCGARRARAVVVCRADRPADREPRRARHRQRSADRHGRDREGAARRDREVWGTLGALATVAVAVNVAVIAMLRLFGRVLDPRRRPWPRRSRTAQLPRGCRGRAGAGPAAITGSFMRWRKRSMPRTENDAQPSADHRAGRRAKRTARSCTTRSGRACSASPMPARRERGAGLPDRSAAAQ